MSLFRKKEEVLVNPGSKKKKQKAGKVTIPEDFSVNLESFSDQKEEDAYPDSFMLPDEPEQPVKAKKKEKIKGEKKALPKSEAPFYKNRLIIGAACVITSSLIAFVLVPVMSYVTSVEMTTVARITVPVAKGKLLEKSMVQIVELPASGVPDTALRDAQPAVGKYAAVDLVAGDMLMTSKLTETMPFPDDYLYSIPIGQQAISATIQTFAGGLSGKLRAGDIVSVYAVLNQTGTTTEQTEYPAEMPEELRYVRVLAVTNKLGADGTESPSPEQVMDEETQPVSVTLLVNDLQAAAIAGLEAKAKLHLSLVSRGDEQVAQGCLDAQNAYFLAMDEELEVVETTEITEITEEIEINYDDLEPVPPAESEAAQ